VSAAIDPRYMKRAREIVENMERQKLDKEQALLLALAKGIELTHRVKHLQKSRGSGDGIALSDGTTIRARREGGKLTITEQPAGGFERMLMTVG
jgi:hypothetical protein